MRLLLLAGCLSILVSACSVKEDLCAAYLCEARTVNLRFQFKDANNKDLLFSPNPTYRLSDLKIYSSLFKENIPFRVDSTNKSNKYILVSVANSQSLTLKLENKVPDVLNIETLFKEEGCCGNMEVLSLQLNQATVCNQCNTIQPITLIK